MFAGLLIGFIGSLHCIVMCGPLSLFILGKKGSPSHFITYHIGRILGYSLIGLALGLVGQSLSLFNIQEVISIFIGLGLITIYGIPGFQRQLEKKYYQSLFYSLIKKIFRGSEKSKNRFILAGIVNGFLPCGLTYVAAAGAIVTGGIIDGFIFMLLFGLGTIPAMIVISFGGNYLSKRFSAFIPNAISFLAVASGSILIARGILNSSPDIDSLVRTRASELIAVCGF